MLNGLYILDERWQPLVYPPDIGRALASAVNFAHPRHTARSVLEHPEVLEDVDVIFTSWSMVRMDRALLERASRLRAIFHAAGSIRYFVTPEFWERGIIVSTAHEINAVPVAEYTVAAILFGLRHGWHHASLARATGRFSADQSFPGAYRGVVGLISLGAVGRLVREKLRAFDVRVIAYDPHCTGAQAAALELELVSLDQIFERADVVSVHTPLIPETVGLIRDSHFSAMRRNSTFINTARGALVREAEMIAALEARPDLQAILDVTSPEPPIADSPLFRLPNVVLTPHIAGTGEREAARLGQTMLEEFQRWNRGEPLRYAITAEQAARLA